MPFPSYYETDIDRARKRSQEMQQEMGGAVQTAQGSVMQALQQKLKQDQLDKENARADAASQLEQQRFGEEKSQHAAENARADTTTADTHQAALDTHAAQPDIVAARKVEIAGRQNELDQAKHAQGLAAAKAAVVAHFAKNGPGAEIPPDAVAALQAKGISPDEVNSIASDVTREYANEKFQHDLNMSKAKTEADRAAEDVRHNKAMEAMGWSGQKKAYDLESMKEKNAMALEQMKLDAEKEKGAKKGQDAVAAIRTGQSLLKDVQDKADQIEDPAHYHAVGTALDVTDDSHDVMTRLGNKVASSQLTPKEAATEAAITNFVEHSVKTLEGVGRSVSKEQVNQIRNRMLGAIHTGDKATRDAQLNAIMEDLAREAGAAPGAAQGAPGAAPSVPSQRANPF